MKIKTKLYYTTDRYGTKRYYNSKNELHRVDGPAIIYKNGRYNWVVNDYFLANYNSCNMTKKLLAYGLKYDNT